MRVKRKDVRSTTEDKDSFKISHSVSGDKKTQFVLKRILCVQGVNDRIDLCLSPRRHFNYSEGPWTSCPFFDVPTCHISVFTPEN